MVVISCVILFGEEFRVILARESADQYTVGALRFFTSKKQHEWIQNQNHFCDKILVVF